MTIRGVRTGWAAFTSIACRCTCHCRHCSWATRRRIRYLLTAAVDSCHPSLFFYHRDDRLVVHNFLCWAMHAAGVPTWPRGFFLRARHFMPSSIIYLISPQMLTSSRATADLSMLFGGDHLPPTYLPPFLLPSDHRPRHLFLRLFYHSYSCLQIRTLREPDRTCRRGICRTRQIVYRYMTYRKIYHRLFDCHAK